MTGAFGTSTALPANLNGHIIYNPVAVAPSAHRHRHRIAPPPVLCVFPAPRSPSRCSPHSLTHFVQISLVSSFLKAWEKINTLLALLSLPSAEHEVVGLACHGNSVLQSPLLSLCLLALSLTNLCLPWTTSQHLFLRFGLGWLSCHLSGIQGCHMKLACPSVAWRAVLRSPTENRVNGFWIFWMAMGHSHVLCKLIACMQW